MKSKMLFALVLMVAFFNNAAIANPVVPTKSVVELEALPIEKTEIKVGATQKTLIVNVTTAQSEEVFISIEDTEGVVFHSERVTVANDFNKRYNLKNIPAGSYRLVIKKRVAKTILPIEISGEKIDVVESKREIIALPMVHLDAKSLRINVPTKKSATYNVQIFDNLGGLVFEKSYTELGFHRYDISTLPNGAYIIEVDGETYPISLK
jgi:hypothetical protein